MPPFYGKARTKPLHALKSELTANRLHELKLIDNIVPEPLGGAHRNYAEMAAHLKQRLLDDLADLEVLDQRTLLDRRLPTFDELRLLLIKLFTKKSGYFNRSF